MTITGKDGEKQVDLGEVGELVAMMSSEDGVFSTDIKMLKRCRDALSSLVDEAHELRKERARMDFILKHRTTWYPGRARNGSGNGLLCYQFGNSRREVEGATMRDALDVARAYVREAEEKLAAAHVTHP
ncbi:hypothetical protein AB4Y45_33255 [Paraburkholderia sp. EG287A]|uniref:hypothetical protein n=1 Tax=Paraburkholderia sp. EG287A TaxID=3237012 RepID=UPI0034D2513D